MYRFKWPVKFSSPIAKFGKFIKTIGNTKPIRMVAKIPKRILAFAVVLIMLLTVNGAFWFFRATHQGANPGEDQTPDLREWQIDLNENLLDEEKLKKEYTAPDSRNQSEAPDNKTQQNVEAGGEETQKSSSGGIGAVEEDQPASQNPSSAVESITPEVETAAAVSQPTLNTMAMPAVGKVTAEYAVYKLIYSKTLEQWCSHYGIDISADEGSQVKAAMEGTVVDVRSNDPKLGVVVVIDHGGDVRTLYGNLSSDKLVQKGKYVNKGQVIGAVGKTAPYEMEDPPHLHFEVLKGGENIDPQEYLPKIK